MDNWVISIIEKAGYFGVFILMVLENVFPPIPSEVVLPLAGYMASKGTFQPIALGVAATAGSTVGTYFWYWLAAKLGKERLMDLTRRKGRWIAVSPEELDKSLSWFERHGVSSLLFGRCIPGIRSIISAPAGLTHMPHMKFLALTVIGSAVWSAVLIGIGYTLGAQYEAAGEWIGKLGNAAFLPIAVLYVTRVIRGNKSEGQRPVVGRS